MSRIVSVTLWDDLECAGGVRLGDLRVVRGTASMHLDSSDACSLLVDVDGRVIEGANGQATVRTVVRLEDGLGTVVEYRMSQLGHTLRTNQWTLQAVSPLLDLASAGVVRSVVGGVTTFGVGGTYTPSDFIDTIILSDLATDGLTWLSRGTIDPTAPVTLFAADTGSTRLDLLRQLADLTGSELRLRRVGSTGYAIDLTPVGTTATPLHIAMGKNLVDFQQDFDDADGASAVTVLGATASGWDGPATMAENAWTLGTIPGSAPYWIPLTDPGGGAGPVGFAGQLLGSALLLNDGTTLTITDSRTTPDNAVEVAAPTGLTAGDRVQIVAGGSAQRIVTLTTPGVRRVHRVDTGAASRLRGEANLVANGTFATWASDDLPTGFGTTNGRRYPRTTPTTLTMTVASNAPDLTVVNISGGTPNARTFLHDYWVVSGSISTTIKQIGAVNLDGSGAGVFSFQTLGGSTALALVAGDTLTLSATTQLRPTAFPDDGFTTDVIRLDSTGAGVRGPSWRIKYLAGMGTLNAAAWVTEINKSGGDILAVNCMSLDIRDMAGPSTLVTANASADLTNGSMRSDVLSATYTLSGDLTVAARVNAIGVPSVGSYCRAIMLWLSPQPAEVPPAVDGSWGNALWQRANRVLLGRAATVSQLRVTMRDLSAAAGYSITREQLVLGGDVVLDDLGITVRLIGMTVPIVGDLTDVQVLLDSRPTSLVQFLAERV